MKISVVTPTVRPQGLKITAQSLKNQTFIKDQFQWIVCSPKVLEKDIKEVVGDIFPYIFIGNEPLKKGMFWDLAYSYNKMVRKAEGELLVSLQDWIYVYPSGLEQYWESYKIHPNSVITGVGNQFLKLDENNIPILQCWKDPRIKENLPSFRECEFIENEWNWCSVPKKLIEEVNYFDEKLDWLGFVPECGFQMNERLYVNGKKFYLDQSNISKTLRHNRDSYGGADIWEVNNTMRNGKYQARRERLIKEGHWPILDNSSKT